MKRACRVNETTLTKQPKKTAIQATQFAAEYTKNGMNGTRAVLKYKPHLQESSAAQEASKLLRTPKVQEELERINNKVEVSAIRTRTQIIERFDHLSHKAEQHKQYTAAINATKEIGTLSRVYDQEDNEASNYNTFIGNLTVNQVTKGDSTTETVEIEAEYENVPSNQVVTEED